MTQTSLTTSQAASLEDLFGSAAGKEVDPEHAANTLGSLMTMLGSAGGDAASPISQGIGTTTADSGSTASSTPATGTATGTATGGHADPVPEGTGVAQGYGGDGGHPGIDLAVPLDTQLLAAASGTVTHASNDDPHGYGNEVEISTADGFQIRYGHLHGMNVKVGDTVNAGQVIGSSGGEKDGPTSGNSSGPHLHFEVRTQGHSVDPTPFLAGGYNIVGGSSSSPTPTSADPQAIAAVQLQNVINVLGNKPLQDSTPTQQSTTDTAGTGSTSDTDPAAVNSFLAATRQHESGGNYQARYQGSDSDAAGAYQFISTTWKGVGGSTASAADASPEEQDRVARNYAMSLFNQFHSWKLVAMAWFGGPGVAEQAAQGQDPGQAPGGQGSYSAYGDTIQRMMSGGK